MIIRMRQSRSFPCGVNFADGYDAAERVLASSATGVLAFNDLVAMGLMSALSERGVGVQDRFRLWGSTTSRLLAT